MSYQQAFITQGTWSDDTRKHPALRATEGIFNFFDGLDHSARDDFYTKDWTLITPYGERLESGDWAEGAKRIYLDRYSSYRHVPYTCIVTELEGGYDVYSLWNLYVNIKGEAKKEKVTDESGQEWDLRLPEFYRLSYVKVEGAGHDGLQIRHCHLIKDTKLADDLARAGGIEVEDKTFTVHNNHHEHMKHVNRY